MTGIGIGRIVQVEIQTWILVMHNQGVVEVEAKAYLHLKQGKVNQNIRIEMVRKVETEVEAKAGNATQDHGKGVAKVVAGVKIIRSAMLVGAAAVVGREAGKIKLRA